MPRPAISDVVLGHHDDALREGWASGETMRSLAARLGVSDMTVARRMRTLGLVLPDGSMNRQRILWTDAMEDKLRTMSERGYGAEVIGAALGMSDWAVRVKQTALGIQPPGMSARVREGVAARRAERDARTTTRPCMTCRTVFASEGAHNRMCDRCRLRPDADYMLSGVRVHG